jgi:hypothetical protein
MNTEKLTNILTSYKWNNVPLEKTIAIINGDDQSSSAKGAVIKKVKDMQKGKSYLLSYKNLVTVNYTYNAHTGSSETSCFTLGIEDIVSENKTPINIYVDLNNPQWTLIEKNG